MGERPPGTWVTGLGTGLSSKLRVSRNLGKSPKRGNPGGQVSTRLGREESLKRPLQGKVGNTRLWGPMAGNPGSIIGGQKNTLVGGNITPPKRDYKTGVLLYIYYLWRKTGVGFPPREDFSGRSPLGVNNGQVSPQVGSWWKAPQCGKSIDIFNYFI